MNDEHAKLFFTQHKITKKIRSACQFFIISTCQRTRYRKLMKKCEQDTLHRNVSRIVIKPTHVNRDSPLNKNKLKE